MNEIVTFGHPALNMKSKNVENIDDYIVSLTKRMIDIMYEAPGVGLAAPQIGINKNLFVFDAGDGPKVAINPKIEDLQGTIVFMEGCLSLPGYYWDIERHEYAKVSCINEKGEEVISERHQSDFKKDYEEDTEVVETTSNSESTVKNFTDVSFDDIA